MTREESAQKLKSFCHTCKDFPYCVHTDKECFEALDMAIKALEQEDKINKLCFDLWAENEELEAEIEKYKKAIEDIKADIMHYEADCLLLEDRPICKECNDTMFGSIYHIIDKHINGKEQNNE